MKKLILVTLLAFAASWALHEARQGGDERQNLERALDEFKARYGDVPRHTLVLDDGLSQLVPARPPTPPSKPARKKPAKPPKQAPPSLLEAQAAPDRSPPSWFPKSEAEEEASAKGDGSGWRVLIGRLSASDDRARRDLRQLVEREVGSWLAADVPPSWKVPARVLDAMAAGSYTQEVTRSLIPPAPEAGPAENAELPGLDGLYTLHRAAQRLDFSPRRRAEILGMYRRDLASGRMHRLGGGLAVALVGLAVLSGYIRADEATKGYYTNRLRLVAAAGLGAAGAAAYRFFA